MPSTVTRTRSPAARRYRLRFPAGALTEGRYGDMEKLLGTVGPSMFAGIARPGPLAPLDVPCGLSFRADGPLDADGAPWTTAADSP
jgi:hypothetical protein